MTVGQVLPYRVTDGLPWGRSSIEASAGTGKTTALAGLATRYVAEAAVPVSELLVVTFTRAATHELRARVRNRLVDAAAALRAPEGSTRGDELLEHLVSTDRSTRLDRVERALEEFDAAVITTIHGFATQVRGVLGNAAGIDPLARLDDDVDGTLAAACTDVLAAASVTAAPADGLPGLAGLLDAVRIAVAQPDLTVVPDGGDGADVDDVRAASLVRAAIGLAAQRRAMAGVMSFDDVLTQLRSALRGSGAAGALEAMRRRFRVALIDEFQDTDPVQWDIFSELFDPTARGRALVLVGDAKQAIYAFRGADVGTYLRAVDGTPPGARRALMTNWRSDGAVVRSLDALLRGVAFGDDRIAFTPVQAAGDHEDRHLTLGDDVAPAVSLRLATGGAIQRTANGGRVRTAAAADAIAADLVAHVQHLLDDAKIPAGQGEGLRSLRPSDIAVLATTGATCDEFNATLAAGDVPSVVAGARSVLDSEAAGQLRILLHAMRRPSDPRAARMLALSWFFGWTAQRVAGAHDSELEQLHECATTWSDLLSARPVTEVFERIRSETAVAPRILQGPAGDRNLTDLDHLVELFRSTTPNGSAGIDRLWSVLDGVPGARADTEVDADVTARRVESEADAVQVMTVWTAKGLEFPVVCVPNLWRWGKADSPPVVTTDPVTGVRTFDVTGGGPWPDKAAGSRRKGAAEREVAGEKLRLLYVALTRARHHLAVWWANAPSSDKTALGHVLFARRGAAVDPRLLSAPKVAVPSDDDVVGSLDGLVTAADGAISVVAVGHAPATVNSWAGRHASPTVPVLEIARFERELDRSRRRWSFTALVDETVAWRADPDDATGADRGADDEGDDVVGDGFDDAEAADGGRTIAAPRGSGPGGQPGPLATLPAGTDFGTLVHSLFEEVDLSAPGARDALCDALDRQLERRPLDLTPVDGDGESRVDGRSALVDGLLAAAATPLGPIAGGARLGDVGPTDRLGELAFDLRLGDGGRLPDLPAIGRIVASRLDPSDPLLPWAAALAERPVPFGLGGHLTGSIDLVLRVRPDGGVTRYLVADYKTNLLTPRGSAPADGDYAPERLVTAMLEHDYPLQALLYSVALHRYLRWRLPEYRPDVHLGGVAYLFVRGMRGPETPLADGRPHGVFAWELPPGLVTDLSDLLEGVPIDGVPDTEVAR